jgi:hypothetical protein
MVSLEPERRGVGEGREVMSAAPERLDSIQFQSIPARSNMQGLVLFPTT